MLSRYPPSNAHRRALNPAILTARRRSSRERLYYPTDSHRKHLVGQPPSLGFNTPVRPGFAALLRSSARTTANLSYAARTRTPTLMCSKTLTAFLSCFLPGRSLHLLRANRLDAVVNHVGRSLGSTGSRASAFSHIDFTFPELLNARSVQGRAKLPRTLSIRCARSQCGRSSRYSRRTHLEHVHLDNHSASLQKDGNGPPKAATNCKTSW